MYPYLFEIGPITVASFGLMVAIGFLVALHVLGRELQYNDIDEPSEVAALVIHTALIGGLIGAKGYFLLIETPEPLFSDQWFDLLRLENLGYGLTWYGGFIVATIAVLLRLRRKQLPALVIADNAVIALAIGYAIGRIGCQLAGDGDYGVPTDLPWGMAYPDGVVPTSEKVHPAPVYETLSHLLIYATLKMLRRSIWAPGQLVAVYFFLAGIARFGVESIRLNPRIAFGLSEAQIISLLLIFVGLIWGGILFRQHRGGIDEVKM